MPYDADSPLVVPELGAAYWNHHGVLMWAPLRSDQTVDSDHAGEVEWFDLDGQRHDVERVARTLGIASPCTVSARAYLESDVTMYIGPDTVAAINRVVTYLWKEEEDDYREQDAEGRIGHIYISLAAIEEWLEGNDADFSAQSDTIAGTLVPRPDATVDTTTNFAKTSTIRRHPSSHEDTTS